MFAPILSIIYILIGENQMICSRLMNLAINSLTGNKVSVKSKIEALLFISDCLYENSKYLIDPFQWLFVLFVLFPLLCEISHLTHFWPMFLFYTPRCTRKPKIFWCYKMGTLTRNWLNLVDFCPNRTKQQNFHSQQHIQKIICFFW